MLFELHNGVPDVSPAWVTARDAFLKGNVRRAWALVLECRGKVCLSTGNDYILNVEIARACGAHKRSLALVRLAHRRFPDEPYVRLHFARMLLSRQMHTPAIEYLRGCEETLGKTHRALWASQLASIYASAGFEASCRRLLAEAARQPGHDSPLALYTESCAYTDLSSWADATRVAQECLAAAPRWVRVRCLLIHTMLSNGQIDQAQAELAAAQSLGIEDAMLDLTVGMLAFSLGQFAEALAAFEAFLERWPQADWRDWVRRTLCLLLVEHGRCDQATDVAAGREEALGLPGSLSVADDTAHRFLPLPLLVQSSRQCVPTSLAMALWPQRGQLDPDRLFREMHGRDGTALWQMRRWVVANGFRLIPIRLDKAAFIEMLEHNIPLIGVLEGAFSSHVDVVCGYHTGLEVFYVRDPAHWVPAAIPWDMALKRYELHGAALAVIDVQRGDAIAAAERLKSPTCDALIDLAEAVAEGDRQAAERAFGQIPDDSPSAFLRDAWGCLVAVSPDRVHENMQRLARDDSANEVARFRALLGMNLSDAQMVLEQMASNEGLGASPGMLRYIRLQRHMHDGKWNEANGLVDQLLVRGGGVSHFWDLKGDVLAELGDQAGSMEALDRAIELEPFRMVLREKSLGRSATSRRFTDFLDEFEALLRKDPNDKRLLWGRAMTLSDGPDGRAYEAAARDYLRWFPRDPRGYISLMNWYRGQGREDLANTLLEEARLLLPETFPEPPATMSSDTTAELPEDKPALLALVWDRADPRRPEAMKRLLEMEQSGQLLWYERASLLANRLLDDEGLPLATERKKSAGSSRYELPLPVPGAAHWFCNTVADALTDNEPRLDVVLAVNEWIEQAVPDYRNYVGLWFNRILLLEKAHHTHRAFRELTALVEHYPAYSSALYRMGMVKYGQGDCRKAAEFMQQALDVNPGLPGAVNMLRAIHEDLGNGAEILRRIGMQRKKFPYSFDLLRDQVSFVAMEQGLQAAKKTLRQYEDDFCPRRVQLLRARLAVDQTHLDRAERILSEVLVGNQIGDDLFEDSLGLRFAIAQQRGDRQGALNICDDGLRRWPDSTRLKEIKAEHLAVTQPEAAGQLLLEALRDGHPEASTAMQYLQTANGSPMKAAQRAITQADPQRRQSLAELFAEVFNHPSLLAANGSFLEWALEQYPESDPIRWNLASHYDASQKPRRAVTLAEELYRRNPHNVEARRMLGRCLIPTDAKRAVGHLEMTCALNPSANNLFDLARAYAGTGDRTRSAQMHWRVLDQDPFLAASWTNLFLANEPREKLWPLVAPMLERGCGLYDEYFLVATVKAALTQRAALPAAWFPIAVQRYQVLRVHPAFGNENAELTKAIFAWLAVRPDDRPTDAPLPRDPFLWLSGRYGWPRRKWWIPRP